jgi:hypothetical protein
MSRESKPCELAEGRTASKRLIVKEVRIVRGVRVGRRGIRSCGIIGIIGAVNSEEATSKVLLGTMITAWSVVVIDVKDVLVTEGAFVSIVLRFSEPCNGSGKRASRGIEGERDVARTPDDLSTPFDKDFGKAVVLGAVPDCDRQDIVCGNKLAEGMPNGGLGNVKVVVVAGVKRSLAAKVEFGTRSVNHESWNALAGKSGGDTTGKQPLIILNPGRENITSVVVVFLFELFKRETNVVESNVAYFPEEGISGIRIRKRIQSHRDVDHSIR